MHSATSLWRQLTISAAFAALVALSGCNTDGVVAGKALKALSPQMIADIEAKNMTKDSPILVRIFKEESEVEVWKQDNSGRLALLKTYPICRWSGELGPKIKEGDRQAPEGFYTITPAQMNPNSQYYLSFNIGYPNEFDRALGRTGAHLMVHGDCSSRGCYAMTDDQIGEIYALARDSFFGGQRSFQIQAYPFRMTPLNMAKHRNSPHTAFWKMLKKGYDHFEVSRLEPKVNVCEKRYVFDAEQPANSTKPLSFDPAGRCPAYQVNEDLVAAVNEKSRRDDAQFAELVQRNTATLPVRTGRDGGMHPSFLAKLQPREIRDRDGTVMMVVDEGVSKSLGSYVNPPHDPEPAPETAVAEAPMPRPAPLAKQGAPSPVMSLAAAEPKSTPQSVASTNSPASSGGFFGTMSRWMGLGEEPKPAAARSKAAPAPKPAVAALPKPHPAKPETHASAAPVTASPAASTPRALVGAQPVVQADSFESRFSGR